MLQTVQWPIFVQTNLTQEMGSPKQIGWSVSQSAGWLGGQWVVDCWWVGGHVGWLVGLWSSVVWSMGHQSAGWGGGGGVSESLVSRWFGVASVGK